MLALINDHVKENDIKEKETARRIETLIRDKLDKEEATRAEVRAWLNNNLEKR